MKSMHRHLWKGAAVLMAVAAIFAIQAAIAPAPSAEGAQGDVPVAALSDMNRAFVAIAKSASPAVVSVRVEKEAPARRQFNGGHGMPNDLFERFFGGQMPQQGPQRRMP
ncbi:MAG: hypothetical protein GY851_05820, partial [bacterium]|nr:hypothetical protein [bacterium]